MYGVMCTTYNKNLAIMIYFLYLGTTEFLLENGSYLESSDEVESSESD
ncbi:hypothetical protein L798_03160 [Zootermopsis nevadensis]|uniref:Uncharacterized protein n=1 Tax=Zootermopsis nevadensis TaxID=136037 RepID=A0A067RNR5_ZOONE|nr:hypothetical protein L798_03160 [Zootermopsis nevadensis]